MMGKPTIVFVPGLWEGPEVFGEISTALASTGYETCAVKLASTGRTSPGNPSALDDMKEVRAVVEPLVEEQEKEVLLVMHSAGGVIGSGAVEGLIWGIRGKEGKKGGVRHLLYIAAGVAAEGETMIDLPFMDFQGDKMFCHNPRMSLFNDLQEDEANQWMGKLQHQPGGGWNAVIPYGAWKEVESTFLICQDDQILPTELQKHFAGLAGSRVETCNAGHMAMLSAPDLIVDLIKRLAGD